MKKNDKKFHSTKNEMNKKVCANESRYGYQIDPVVS